MKQVCKEHVSADWGFHMQTLLKLTLVESFREHERAPGVLALRDVSRGPEGELDFESCSCKVGVT